MEVEIPSSIKEKQELAFTDNFLTNVNVYTGIKTQKEAFNKNVKKQTA